ARGGAPEAPASPEPVAGGGTVASPAEPVTPDTTLPPSSLPVVSEARHAPDDVNTCAMPVPVDSAPVGAQPEPRTSTWESPSALPSASPEPAAAFDRSPAAWMERLRADEQRRARRETAALPEPVEDGSGIAPVAPPEPVDHAAAAASAPQAPVEDQGGKAPVARQTPLQESTPAVPSALPEPVAAFDRSPAAWMERLRADEQRRRDQAVSASAGETTPTPPIVPAPDPAPEPPGVFAPGLPASRGTSEGPDVSTASEDTSSLASRGADVVTTTTLTGVSAAPSPAQPEAWSAAAKANVSPAGQASSVAAPNAGAAPSVTPTPTAAPPSVSAASSIAPPKAGDAPQPADPATAVVDAARAWVAQRMQERAAASTPQQPAPPPPAAPKSQPQSQAPIEIRVARPPRFVEERAPCPAPPDPAPVAETPQAMDQPPVETPAFDRSVEAWMERLRADEIRRRQKDAAAQAPGDVAEDPRSVDAPLLAPAQPVGAIRSSGSTGTAPGSEPRRPVPQPVRAPLPGGAALSERATRFAPPVSAPARSTALSSARFFAPSAPSLSESNRRFLRAAVGVDPATVRVARGPEAARVAAAYRADAVTFGDDVALAPARGDETAEGLGLLAHELTHVARRHDSTAIPPIVRPPEQRPGLRPAPPGPSTDEESLARTVEAQMIQAARMRFAPPVMPAHTGASTAPPVQASEQVHPAPSSADVPDAPERARWGNLPAPWEPLPDWLAPPRPAAEAPPLPVVTVAPAPPALTGPQQAGAPIVRTAETARALPAVQRAETTAPAQEASPAPDLDELARQVYAVLKRRLAVERRRSGW
ncbi:MAG: eCIS core domain-containing protein, partial [Roseiflexus sp.]